MPSRRDAITLTAEEIGDYLDERHVINIATNGPSGHPHLVAMWYGFVGGQIAFWTFGRSQKIVNLRRDPKLTALIETGETYEQLKGVEIIGEGRIVEDHDTIVQIGLSVAGRYQGVSAGNDAVRRFVEAQAAKRLGVILDVASYVSWDHSKLGGTY